MTVVKEPWASSKEGNTILLFFLLDCHLIVWLSWFLPSLAVNILVILFANRFGIEGADDAIRGLSCIWISHIHGDHHTGLARILALRRDLLKGVPHEPLLVVGPWRLKRFLDAYQRLEDLNMQFLDCKHTTESSFAAFNSNEVDLASRSAMNDEDIKDADKVRIEDQKNDTTLFARGSRMQSYFKRPSSPVENATVYPILKTLIKALREAGLEALISFPVIHCPQAYGVVLKAADRTNGSGKTIPGWKIVYSGDTRPCPELVKASNGATVLIHEVCLNVHTYSVIFPN